MPWRHLPVGISARVVQALAAGSYASFCHVFITYIFPLTFAAAINWFAVGMAALVVQALAAGSYSSFLVREAVLYPPRT